MDTLAIFDKSRAYSGVLAYEEWAAQRHAHPAVAAAIHAIASPMRSADAILSHPTAAELRSVAERISGYISAGAMIPESDGEYAWGWRPLIVLHVGALIDIGVGDDRDSGRVLAVGDRRVFVAWESGVKSWAPISSLWVHAVRPYTE